MEWLKRLAAQICVLLLLPTILAVPALANSAQSHWIGTNSTGAIITGESCPIAVEHERLTFDIQQFPEQHYWEVGDYLAYTGKVTAEYTFHNPADYAVTATLVFPFGAIPDYGHLRDGETDEILRYSDTDKYDITVDGAAIDRTLRHTLTFFGAQFELEEDMAKLHDGYMVDDFYSLDMPVTRYTYTPSDVDIETYDAANAAFILSADPAKTKIFMENQNGGKLLDDAVQMEGWVDLDEPFVVNVIGEPLEQMPAWKFYENGACEDEISGTMTLTHTETVSFREFVLSEYDPASGVLEHDWYNAIVSAMKYFEWEHGAIHSSEVDFDISDQLMRWYEYEITIEPGERIVNTVTAPLYPSIDSSYEPSIYEYTYLLSPAQTWAKFGTLDIVVNTPFYMIESSSEGFEWTNPGYTQHLDGLPEGELTFTLCAEVEPEVPIVRSYFPTEIIFVAIGALVVIGVVIIFAVHKRRKKSNGA